MAKEKPTGKRRSARPVEIRPMEIDDLAQVFHLGEELFTAREAPNLYRTWDEGEVIELFRVSPELCLVAAVGDRTVGFALGTTVRKTRSAWKYGHLVWLGIQPKLQRRGVALRLWNEFQDLVLESGVRMLMVDTEADNEAALRFFHKVGFGSPEKHIYLSLNLDSKRRGRTPETGKGNGGKRSPSRRH